MRTQEIVKTIGVVLFVGCLAVAGSAMAAPGKGQEKGKHASKMDCKKANPTIYFKVFRPAEDASTSVTYHCKTRDDTVLSYRPFTSPIPPEDPYYQILLQYDPIAATSVLCRGQWEGTSRPQSDYSNFPGDYMDVQNFDGSPLATWGVKAYCNHYGFDETAPPQKVPAAEIILTCIKHKRLPVPE